MRQKCVEFLQYVKVFIFRWGAKSSFIYSVYFYMCTILCLPEFLQVSGATWNRRGVAPSIWETRSTTPFLDCWRTLFFDTAHWPLVRPPCWHFRRKSHSASSKGCLVFSFLISSIIRTWGSCKNTEYIICKCLGHWREATGERYKIWHKVSTIIKWWLKKWYY